MVRVRSLPRQPIFLADDCLQNIGNTSDILILKSKSVSDLKLRHRNLLTLTCPKSLFLGFSNHPLSANGLFVGFCVKRHSLMTSEYTRRHKFSDSGVQSYSAILAT
jgi:hypothetical protein